MFGGKYLYSKISIVDVLRLTFVDSFSTAVFEVYTHVRTKQCASMCVAFQEMCVRVLLHCPQSVVRRHALLALVHSLDNEVHTMATLRLQPKECGGLPFINLPM